MSNNFFLGDNELVIAYRSGSCHVIEKYEDWETVYFGDFGKCLQYCKEREIAYMESIIG